MNRLIKVELAAFAAIFSPMYAAQNMMILCTDD